MLLTPDNQPTPDTLVGILGAEDYQRLIASVSATRESGRLLDWQKELLEKITNKTGFIISTQDQFFRIFGNRNQTDHYTFQQRFFTALYLTASFAATVYTFGLIWTLINCFWLWDANVPRFWLSRPNEAFLFGFILTIIFTFLASLFFCFIVFVATIKHGNYIQLPSSRIVLYGFLWGAALMIGLFIIDKMDLHLYGLLWFAALMIALCFFSTIRNGSH